MGPNGPLAWRRFIGKSGSGAGAEEVATEVLAGQAYVNGAMGGLADLAHEVGAGR
jgi:hypothetical protein